MLFSLIRKQCLGGLDGVSGHEASPNWMKSFSRPPTSPTFSKSLYHCPDSSTTWSWCCYFFVTFFVVSVTELSVFLLKTVMVKKGWIPRYNAPRYNAVFNTKSFPPSSLKQGKLSAELVNISL